MNTVSSSATLSLPVAVRYMIDHGFGGGSQINLAFGLLFVVAVVLAVATAARFFFVSLLGEKVVADLRGQPDDVVGVTHQAGPVAADPVVAPGGGHRGHRPGHRPDGDAEGEQGAPTRRGREHRQSRRCWQECPGR